MGSQLKERYSRHQDFALLLLLFTTFRLLALLLLRPGGHITAYSDYNTSYLPFAQWSDKGLYPFVDYWLEWPPLFPWLVVGVYRLSLLIPSWVDPFLWYDTLLGLSLLPFEVGNLVLIYLLALEFYPKERALKSAWIYALLFSPLYFWTGWFDTMPLFFTLLSLYLMIRQRAIVAGVASGLGFMIKISPAILLPVGWKALQGGRRKVHLLIAFFLTVLVIAAPFLLTHPQLLLASFRSMIARSSWETIWALLEGYYSYGVVVGHRFDPWAQVANHPSTLPWPLITLAFGLLYLYLWLFMRPIRPIGQHKARILAFAGLTVNLFTLYNRGYSPQFLVQLIPFIVLLLPNLRGVTYIILLEALNFLESTVYFIMLPDEKWLLVGTVVGRTLLILALCAEYGVVFFSLPRERVARVRRRAFSALVVLFLLAGLLGGYHLAGAYGEARYAQEEYRPLIEFLRSVVQPREGVIICPDHPLYQRLYPFLWEEASLYVADERTLPHIMGKYSDLWLLERQEGELQDRFPIDMELVAVHNFSDIQISHFKAKAR